MDSENAELLGDVVGLSKAVIDMDVLDMPNLAKGLKSDSKIVKGVDTLIEAGNRIGLYGTFYRGIGVQVGDGGSTTNVAQFLFNLMIGGGMSWSPGDIYSNNGSAFTADGVLAY